MATWSDSKAVMDYQNFLASGKQEIERKSDGPSVIISEGPNEMADALLTMGMGDDIILSRNDALPAEMGGNKEYPIYICLPPTEIESFIRGLSGDMKQRNEDFVFFSGGPYFGNIEDTLKSFGYCRDSMTQVLATGIEFKPSANAVKDLSTRLGTDAMGEEKWAGECCACGKWNGAIGKRMERSDVRCSLDFYRDWRRKMWERNALDGIFNLVGAVREEPTTISDVANYYEQEVSDMLWEVSGSLRGWKAVTLMYGFEERLFGVAENTGSGKQCELNEKMYPFIWGNRVFSDSPTINAYLWYAKENRGLLADIELPPKPADSEISSIMRKGNLRADGVI
eukprot:scaffold1482_cov120-Cylindrotheca_fusiformis.AAC.13